MKKFLLFLGVMMAFTAARAQKIAELVAASPDHTILTQVITETGLTAFYMGEGPITLFAPTDAAFESMPQDLLDAYLADPTGVLRDILFYHTLPGNFGFGAFSDGQTVTTVFQNQSVMMTVDGTTIHVNDALITAGNFNASNGRIHVIDAVLMPQTTTVYDYIAESADLSDFTSALNDAGLDATLEAPGRFTVFAPTNAAFDALPEGFLSALLAQTEGLLADILNHHVLDTTLLAEDLEDGSQLLTLLGEALEVSLDDGTIIVGNAALTIADEVTINGVVHVIDAVNLPAGRTLYDALADHDLDALQVRAVVQVEKRDVLAIADGAQPAFDPQAFGRWVHGEDVEPIAFAEVERIVEGQLGVRISQGFRSFDHEPLAAASLGQVHRAALRDGRPVAVKVQRPGIRDRVAQDLEVVEELADTLERFSETGKRYGLTRSAAELRRSLLQELDYRLEASNLTRLADNLAQYQRIVVPRPVPDYCTSRVLTMEYVHGRKVTSIGPLARMEMEGEALAEELFDAYLKQVLVDGFFHADPHPGNVFLTDDGRIALIDVGMVGRVGPELQDQLTRLLLAFGEQRGEDAAHLLMGMSDRRPDSDRKRFVSEIATMVTQHGGATAGELRIGRLVLAAARMAAECGFVVPSSLTLLGKTLLNLDQVGRTLDPGFEPDAAIRRNAAEMLRQRMLKGASPGNVLSGLLEMNEFTQRLPGRLNRVLDAVADRVQIRITNEAVLMAGMQKVANRVASGLVLAALIIGAAMLMRVETSFRIFGYPGLAMLLFLAAVVGGVMLLADVMMHDRPDPPTSK